VSRLILLILICSLTIALTTAFLITSDAKIDPKDIAGIWLFNEGSGKVAHDSSEMENDGEIIGPAQWVDGKFGKALQFDGNSVRVNVESNDSLLLEEFTIVAWENLEDSQGARWQSIMMKGQNPRNYLLCVDKDSQKLQLSVTKGAKDVFGGPIDGPVVTDGDWHHVAGLAGEKEGFVIYVDGVQVGQQGYSKPSLDAAPSVLTIGDGSGGGHQCEGIIDDVGLFSVPLSEEDINAIMDEGLKQYDAGVSKKGKLATTWSKIKCRY